MPLYKRNVYSGNVLEQEVYIIAENVKDIKSSEPKEPPARTDEERAAHRIAASRLRFRRIFNTNFDPWSFYATMTLDDDHMTDDFEVARKILTNYIRRLRKAFPGVVLVAVMGRGKNTRRIHFHLVIARADESAISDTWNAGSIKRIERLREHNYYEGVDRGCDYTGLANYLFDHWTPEQGEGSKRWTSTRNIRQPIKEKPKLIKRRYDVTKPPKAPAGYELKAYTETPYGNQCFTYVRKPIAPLRC